MESNRVEYKREITDNFEREIVAFLNADGGDCFFGIDDKGKHFDIGDLDKAQLAISERIKNNILPQTLTLYSIFVESINGGNVIKVSVKSGSSKPYYFAKYGMSPKGCFLRVGSGCQPMTTEMIEDMFSRRVANLSLTNVLSPREDLSFETLRIYYQEHKLKLNDKFHKSLDLVDKNNQFNYLAYLCADENAVSMKVAKYKGKTKVHLDENKEYGYCCIIRSMQKVLDRLDIENTTKAIITKKFRKEKSLVDPVALREVFLNAVVHNDYIGGAYPVVEIFDDRIVITSSGGLPKGMTEQEFFSGRSIPRSKELMRVFKDIEAVEQLGSGMLRILDKYDKSCFEISTNFIVVTLPFDFSDLIIEDENVGINDQNVGINVGIKLSKTEQLIIGLIEVNKNITIVEIADEIRKANKTVERVIKAMQTKGVIKRVGSRKTGHWEVVK